MNTTLKRSLVTGLAVLTVAGMAQAAPRHMNIVATTPELGALAATLAGERARVRTIASGREDPHFLQARPTFMVMARDADLWIRMGMDLEIGWEPVLLDGARNAAIRIGQPGHFDAGAFIAYALEVPDATATRAMGDVHPHGNPHYMTDPVNARSVAKALAARLITLDPDQATNYEARLDAFLARLDRAMYGEALVDKISSERLWAAEAEGKLEGILQKEGAATLLGGWRHAMRPWQDKPIIVFHKSWSYLAQRFGLNIVAELEPLPGVPPSPAHLAMIIDLARQENVALIIKEPFYPARPARFVSDKAGGIRVAEVNSYGTDASEDGYFNMMNAIIEAFGK